MERIQPSVSAGDTFLVAQPFNHLYVVCSDPRIDTSKVLLVSFTTFRIKEEKCCMVERGEHPFIQHKSCIRYRDAKTASIDAIVRLVNANQMKRREPVSEDLLARIRKGAGESEYLPEEHRRLLQDQNLI